MRERDREIEIERDRDAQKSVCPTCRRRHPESNVAPSEAFCKVLSVRERVWDVASRRLGRSYSIRSYKGMGRGVSSRRADALPVVPRRISVLQREPLAEVLCPSAARSVDRLPSKGKKKGRSRLAISGHDGRRAVYVLRAGAFARSRLSLLVERTFSIGRKGRCQSLPSS